MKKKILIVLGILSLIVLFTSLSYAYFGYSETQNTFEELGSKCFQLTMMKEGTGITIDKAHPVTDEEGLKQEGYQFSIKNTCTSTAYYQVNLEDLEIEEKELPNQYIKASLNESKGKVINEYEKAETTIENATDSHKLTSGSLEPNKEVEYTLKLWMDYDTPAKEEVMNASYESKISIIASYIEEDKIKNDITITYKEPDYYSKESETVEIRARSENYKIIEYSIDGTTYEPVEEPAYEVTIEEIYTTEGSYPIYFKDEMGNIKEENINLTKLDQTPPEIEIKEENDESGVKLTITFKDLKSGLKGYQIIDKETEKIINEEWETIEGKTATIPYQSNTNKIIIIKTIDQVENEKETEYEITKADIEGPSIEVNNPSEGQWTKEDLTITINATDKISGVDKFYYKKQGEEEWLEIETSNVTITDKNGNATITIRESTDAIYEFKAKDKLGNESTSQTTVVKVDKTIPEYNNFEIQNITTTGYDVYVNEVTDTFSGIKNVEFHTWTEASGKEDITIENGTLEENNHRWLYRVDMENYNHEIGKYFTEVIIYDNAGNETKIESKEATVPGVNITYDYNDPKNYAVTPGNGLLIDGFSGTENYCPELYQMTTSGLSAGDQVILSMDIEYANLTADTTKIYGMFPQAPANPNGWDQGMYGEAVELLGTGTYHYEYKFTITANMLKNQSIILNLRTDNYTGGIIIITNFEVKKENDPKNYALNTGNSIIIENFKGLDNECFDLYNVYLTGLTEEDKLTISFDMNYSNLVADTTKIYAIHPQAPANLNGWDQGLYGKAVELLGTGTYHYEYTFTITSNMLKNQSVKLNLRANYYTGGTIEIRNFKIYRSNTITQIKPYNTPLGTLPKVSESGNRLTGWYTEKQGGSLINSQTLTPSTSQTYYGHYADTVTPTITLNGTTNSSTWTSGNNNLSATVMPEIAGSSYAYRWYQVPEYKYTYSEFNITEHQEDNGSKYWNATYTKTSGTTDEWKLLQFPTYKYTPGKTYRIHFKIRVNSISNMSIELRHALVNNDYGVNRKSFAWNAVTNGWKEYILERTIPIEPYTVGSTTYQPNNLSPKIEIYSSNLALSNGVNSRSVNFDFKDFWVEELNPGENSKIENNLAVKLPDKTLTKSFTDNTNSWYVVEVASGSGKFATSNKFQVNVDVSNPDAPIYSIPTANGSSGWYKATRPTITVTLKDNQSGVSSAKYCTTTETKCNNYANLSLSDGTTTRTGTIQLIEGKSSKVCVQVTDGSGRTNENCSPGYNIDITNPTVQIRATTEDNSVTVYDNGSSDANGISTRRFKIDSNGQWYTGTTSYTFTNVTEGNHTVYIEVTDTAGNVATASTTINVIHYVYLYNKGVVNTDLIGSWVDGSASTALQTGWSGSGTRKDNSDNIEFSIQSYTSYSSTTSRNRAIGIRTQKIINLSDYKSLNIIMDMTVPAYQYYNDTAYGTGAGGRFGTTTNTSSWYKGRSHYLDMYSGSASINWSNVKKTIDLTGVTASQYVFFNIDATRGAYGASIDAKVYKIYFEKN